MIGCKKDVANLLKFSLRKVDYLMARHAIPFYRIGRSVRFDMEKVLRALNKYEIHEVGRRLP